MDMSPEQINEHFYPLVQRVNAAKWYTPHISLSALIPIAYPHVDDEKKADLRGYVSR